METIHHFINGSAHGGSGGRYADVYNPALGEPCARVARARGDDVDAAVAAAAAAFPAWGATAPLARG